MYTRRCWMLGSALLALHGVSPLAWAQTGARGADLRLLIGKATRLSVLSDRVTRCQVQRVLGVLAQRAERQLEDTRREVRDFMAELAAASVSADAKRLLQVAVDAYGAFLKKSQDLDVSKTDGLVAFAQEADGVGDKMDALVTALVAESGQSMGQVLATAAELQRLTQHTAVHFLMASAGIQVAEQLKEVEVARKSFSDKLQGLQTAALKNPAIETQLQLLGPQWLLMSNALGHPGRELKTMENISTTSERLLEVTTSLYRLYDAALKV